MKNHSRRITTKARKKTNRGVSLITLAVLLLLLAVSVKSYHLYERQQSYETRIVELKKELAAEEARTAEVDAYSEYVKTKEYKEAVAKDRLGLIYPDEILLKPE